MRFPEHFGSPLDEWQIIYRVHATRRMFKRKFSEKDVAEVIENGRVIEHYADDFPFPSVLVWPH